jgi:ribonuclease-3
VKGAAALERRLGYRFKDRGLLERALTHRSHRHEAGPDVVPIDYERLEFLGDALLGLFVSERLMTLDPAADEGTLTRRKQAVVSQTTLAAASRRLGLGEALFLGRGEDATGGRTKPSLLADVFESVLAAVYLDGGLRVARAFAKRHLGGELAVAAAASGPVGDDKTRLQETAQARWRLTPRYRMVAVSGPAHARVFTAEVLVGEHVAGEGQGTSRKDAERAAAGEALARLERGGRGADEAI